MFRRLIQLTLVVAVIGAIAVGWAVNHAGQMAAKPLVLTDSQTIILPRGGSLSRLLVDLQQQSLLEERWPYRLYAWMEKQEQVVAGEFQIEVGDSFADLLQKITRGEVLEYQIVFPEGLNFSEWLAVLSRSEVLLQSDSITPADIAPQLDHVEGRLFPDTYYFHRGDSDLDILRRAYQRMSEILDQEWQARSVDLPLEDPYQVLILASIVEKETGVPAERADIAGVFTRRLQKGMRLQSDPTVIYGLGDEYQGNLTRKHLRQSTPYNTYTENGLPPTPIAMPGRGAIHAVLHPAEGSALYFVAKGDGSHHFSATLEEHLQAVREYQLKRKKNYRSSPAG